LQREGTTYIIYDRPIHLFLAVFGRLQVPSPKVGVFFHIRWDVDLFNVGAELDLAG
jgi:hypothetical protein